MRAGVAGFAIVLATGCSLLVDTTGYIGTAAQDAGTSTPSKDASSSADGSVVLSDGQATSTGCAGSTDLLCADFDDGPIEKGWSEKLLNGTGDVAFTDTFVSAPRSFKATIIGGGGQGEKQARLILGLPDLRPDRVFMSMQVLLGEVQEGEAELIKIEDGQFGGGLKIFHGPDYDRLEINLPTLQGTHERMNPFPRGRFIKLELEAQYSRTSGSVSLRIDGAPWGSMTNVPTFENPIDAFFAGLWADNIRGTCTMQMDDVHLRFE